MTVIAHYKDVPKAARGFSVALGNFDGVHAGHRAVLDGALAAGGKLGVATFEPPPRQFFRPDDPPFRIYRPTRRNARLVELGAEAVYELPFNADMAAMMDETFARDVLKHGIGAAHVTVGFDFRFGRGRMGDAGRLASLGRALGFGVTVIEKIEALGTKASSTAIREALIAGEPERAAEILGHDWIADGVVEHGEKRGRELGYPTANLSLDGLMPPKFGVYAVRVQVKDGPHRGLYDGVASLGVRPMFGENKPNLETYIFDFRGDLYGAHLSVGLVAFQRPELTFDGLDALIAQMQLDESEARRILAG